MKLSEYAKRIGVSYGTALRYWTKGLLRGEQLPTGTIIIYENNVGLDKDNVTPKVK